MSKVTLALGSFIVGFSMGAFFMLSGNHTSTTVQPLDPQITAFAFGGEPPVPPLKPVSDERLKVSGSLQSLDGANCKNCDFSGALLTYSGGLFKLDHCSFSVQHVVLKGAAWNTFRFLVWTGAIKLPAPPRNPQLEPKLAMAKQSEVVNWDNE